MFGFTFFGDVCIAAAAYGFGAWSWPWLHQKVVGAEVYAQSLRDKANVILAAVRK